MSREIQRLRDRIRSDAAGLAHAYGLMASGVQTPSYSDAESLARAAMALALLERELETRIDCGADGVR